MMAVVSSPELIDMTHDLYDLRRPAQVMAARILDMRTQDVQAPLIVLMGEDHDCPVTRMMQLAVLHECVQAGLKPAYGIEYPYNQPKNLKYREDFDSDPHVQRLFNDAASLRHCLTTEFFKATSTVWMEHIAQFCTAHNIPVSYNDAARHLRIDVCTDARDPVTIEAADMLGITDDEKRYFCATTSEGVFLRNVIIAQNALEQIQRQKPDVLVHMLGATHVMGSVCKDEHQSIFPYSQSLHRIFKLAGYPVISFLPYDPLRYLPADAPFAEMVAVKGWENARCRFLGDEDVAGHQRYIAARSGLPQNDPLNTMEKMNILARYMKQLQRMAKTMRP